MRNVDQRLDEIVEVREGILTALADELPANLADGGAIRDGYDARLDELRDISRNSKTYLAQIEVRERGRTGIGSLKVRFNNVFGYYLEISKANMHLAPADYERKQTLVNAERFTTPELKELEGKILEAEEKILTLEREIFETLRAMACLHAARIKATAAAVAELDVTVALAEVAAENRYTRPRFSESGEMRVVGGRHPVIEKLTEKRRAAIYPQRHLLSSGDRIYRRHHGSQHGRQVDLLTADRAARDPGAGGLVCAGRNRAASHRRPGVHPHRRGGQPGARPLHLHGGDDRDRRHPEHGHRAQLDRAG